MSATPSHFSTTVTAEGAFGVLAVAKRLKAAGKRVIELEIGDSPFPSPAAAKEAAIAAIRSDQTHYCPAPGLPELREAAADFVRGEFRLDVAADNIVVGAGAKIFETLFCQAFLDPGDGVLVFSPHFPTYLPNIAARGARARLARLTQARAFRPDPEDVARFLREDPKPKAIFLNSPHNPTGGVATADDLADLADLVRGRDIAVFSDEPYCHMVWEGRHESFLAQPGMLEQGVAAYTFSKSYSMSGWRLGFAVSSRETADALARLVNISLSCVPPPVQLAGVAALGEGAAERDGAMRQFAGKVRLLAAGLNRIEGITCLTPGGAFYVFPSVAAICNRLAITSHGLAMYLLEGADDELGVACLGGECFGEAGAGFLRFSCAEPDDALREALDFLPRAFAAEDRVRKYLDGRPEYRLAEAYGE
jgi:aspartate aminotransferase